MRELEIFMNMSPERRGRILSDALLAELSGYGRLSWYDPSAGGATRDDFLRRMAACDVMVTTWGSRPLLAEDLGRTGSLKLVVHGAGSVRKLLPVDALLQGIRVVQCAGAIARAVAHYTVGLIITGLRNAAGRYTLLKSGEKASWPYRDLEQVTVGLVGLSQVGRQVPALLQPFRCRVVAYDPYWDPQDAAQLGVTLVDLDELVGVADVVSLHAPLTPATRNMLHRGLIEQIRPGSLVVNTARGGLVDQEALFARCYAGELTAYVDVTMPEPLPPAHPAWQCPHIFITPHISGPTMQSMSRIGRMVVDTVKKYSTQETLEGEITAERYALLA